MNNITLLPFAGIIIGGYAGIELYDYLVNKQSINPANGKMWLMAAGFALAGLIIGYAVKIKYED